MFHGYFLISDFYVSRNALLWIFKFKLIILINKIEIEIDPIYNDLQAVDAYALIGDVSGLAEKMQSFFMQEVLSVTHSVLKNIIQEVCWCNTILYLWLKQSEIRKKQCCREY